MNYRHGYHAANFADVLKHIILIAWLKHLRLKDKGFCVMDTHAGAGGYDLSGEEAGKTQEWQSGLERVMAAADPPPLVTDYLTAIDDARRAYKSATLYPGSPLLIAHQLRKQDRLVAIEKHPPTADALRLALKPFAQAKAFELDGYAALASQLPPKERRGLVLIDPPFEAEDEFARAAHTIKSGYERWPEGGYLVWYPLKDAQAVARFEAEIQGAIIPEVLIAGLSVSAARERLTSCALLMINPPWTLHSALERTLPWLERVMAQGPGASHRLEWLSGP
ncbi:MAG TPA: 23S rRNA (adenine(2030)-N(6))-methyltransferase RlmJ [Alphaproteobacteria bacterium]|nr:23S rRNA (adenine(2030)-N(6))-methyltransferase RlmJ [Alphaproteobacteria bacterium]